MNALQLFSDQHDCVLLDEARATMLKAAVPLPLGGGHPRVGIVYTGDEHTGAGTSATMLARQAAADGADVGIIEHAGDGVGPLRAALQRALVSCDLVVTTGGGSSGDRDLVKIVLASLGAQFAFTSIATGPAEETGFARTFGALAAVLPADPAAAYLTYVTLLRGVVRRLSGRDDFARAL